MAAPGPPPAVPPPPSAALRAHAPPRTQLPRPGVPPALRQGSRRPPDLARPRPEPARQWRWRWRVRLQHPTIDTCFGPSNCVDSQFLARGCGGTEADAFLAPPGGSAARAPRVYLNSRFRQRYFVPSVRSSSTAKNGVFQTTRARFWYAGAPAQCAPLPTKLRFAGVWSL